MDTVILSSLVFNSIGLVVIALSTALAYCLPNRQRPRRWVLVDADAAPRTSAVSAAVVPQPDTVDILRAA